jgi:hypothetical protein
MSAIVIDCIGALCEYDYQLRASCNRCRHNDLLEIGDQHGFELITSHRTLTLWLRCSRCGSRGPAAIGLTPELPRRWKADPATRAAITRGWQPNGAAGLLHF